MTAMALEVNQYTSSIKLETNGHIRSNCWPLIEQQMINLEIVWQFSRTLLLLVLINGETVALDLHPSSFKAETSGPTSSSSLILTEQEVIILVEVWPFIKMQLL